MVTSPAIVLRDTSAFRAPTSTPQTELPLTQIPSPRRARPTPCVPGHAQLVATVSRAPQILHRAQSTLCVTRWVHACLTIVFHVLPGIGAMKVRDSSWFLFQNKDCLSRIGMVMRPSYFSNHNTQSGKSVSICWKSPQVWPMLRPIVTLNSP